MGTTIPNEQLACETLENQGTSRSWIQKTRVIWNQGYLEVNVDQKPGKPENFIEY